MVTISAYLLARAIIAILFGLRLGMIGILAAVLFYIFSVIALVSNTNGFRKEEPVHYRIYGFLELAVLALGLFCAASTYGLLFAAISLAIFVFLNLIMAVSVN